MQLLYDRLEKIGMPGNIPAVIGGKGCGRVGYQGYLCWSYSSNKVEEIR
jgi:hypothetical protein